MSGELHLRRKWTLRAHGRQIVLVKRPNESAEHVLMKAFLWALYLPEYPEASIEIDVGDRYRPDVIAWDLQRQPTFWAEAGMVSPQKIRSLARRYPDVHFAFAKWGRKLEQQAAMIQKALGDIRRRAPCDVISFPCDSAERFIRDGQIEIQHADLEWRRLPDEAR